MFKSILKKVSIAILVIVGLLILVYVLFTSFYPSFGGDISDERQVAYQKSKQFREGKFNNTKPVPKNLSLSETLKLAYFFFTTEVVNGEPKVQKVWCAVDCGIVVNRDAAKNMIEGGVVDGIGHAMYSQLTFENGKPKEANFNNYQLIRHHQAPAEIEVFFVENEISPTGLGEPGLPPAMGALANAMYQATGRRYYHQPFSTADQGDTKVIG